MITTIGFLFKDSRFTLVILGSVITEKSGMYSRARDPKAERWVQEHVALSFVQAIILHPEEDHVDRPLAAVGSNVGTERHSGISMLVSLDIFVATELLISAFGLEKCAVEIIMIIGLHLSVTKTSRGSVRPLFERLGPAISLPLRELTLSDTLYKLIEIISPNELSFVKMSNLSARRRTSAISKPSSDEKVGRSANSVEASVISSGLRRCALILLFSSVLENPFCPGRVSVRLSSMVV